MTRRASGRSPGWLVCCCVATVLAAVGCSRRAAATLLGLPPPSPPPTQVQRTPPTPQRGQAAWPAAWVVDTARPSIEAFLDPDTVLALLPRDHAGNVDWMAALRDGIIKPRSALPDSLPIEIPGRFKFAFDFYLPGPDSTLHAYFPHSSHTEWLDCKQCHARIFPFRNTSISMAENFQGKYCGECHGKVAFPLTTACERCHVNLALPPNRTSPQLIGTIVMRPAAAGDTAGPSDQLSRTSLPSAQFPHWVHRIRFRCKVCHMAVFEPRAGANAVTMQDIGAGRACGLCHNGTVAFNAGFGNCERCHVPATSADDQ